MARKTKIRESFGDQVLQIVTTIILWAILILVAYPCIYVVACSFSSSAALEGGKVLLFPVDPGLDGYKLVFSYDQIWTGYRNTLFYTVTSVSITMVMQTLMAYPLSKSYYQGKKLVNTILLIAMMTGAGMVPAFMLRKSLGMINTVWVVILAGIVGISNVFILRTSFKSSIPGELFDAARIDGANDFQCLVKIAVPLAKATLSVLVLYSAVGCWNDYMTALIYLNDPELYPLQMFVRSLLSATTISGASGEDPSEIEKLNNALAQVKYGTIVVTTVPVLILYAFVQKYFEKGVMVGSVKG